MRQNGPIKVLVVDDSPLVRSVLTHVLSRAKDIRVIGGAKDPLEARELIIEYRPDVIILDIEMPRMSGITFLQKLMKHYPVPVIMCSGQAPPNSDHALKAIEYGAVDIVTKPEQGGRQALHRLGEDLTEKIRGAYASRPAAPPIPMPDISISSFRAAGLDPNRYIIGIGASTGGTEAIRQTLARMPIDSPPIAMVQHMPEAFTASFANRLNQLSEIQVTEATHQEVLAPGHAVLARGGIQMSVENTGGQLRAVYGNCEPVNRHCPSVDVLFHSLARIRGKQAIGVILTGMGADGAKGLLSMREAGALTIAQDQASCVVYGMPKVAVDLEAALYQCPPAAVAKTIIHALRQQSRRGTISVPVASPP